METPAQLTARAARRKKGNRLSRKRDRKDRKHQRTIKALLRTRAAAVKQGKSK